MTTPTKHTPGPWTVEIVKDGGNWTYNVRTVKPHNPAGCLGKHIATCNPLMEARGESNASLIAAAPDLLAALEDLVERAGTSMHQANSDGAEYDVDAELKAAYAAIAKAKGGV